MAAAAMPVLSLNGGSGKEGDGRAVTFRMVFVALKDGSIGEIWFAAPAGRE